MKKAILILTGVIILAIAVVIFYVLTNLDAIVKTAIEKYGSEATHTAVRVDKVRIKLTEGDGAIYGLTVANPRGFALSHAFSLTEIGLGIDLKSIKQEPYIINHITVRAPKVFIEINKDKKINLNELKKNLVIPRPSGKAKAATSKTSASEPKLVIKNLVFEQGSIVAKVIPLNKDYDLKLPGIKMNNLGGSQGATPTELAREILQRLTDTAAAEFKKKGIDAEIDKLKARAQERIDTEKARLKEKADSKIDEEKKNIEDKLRGLLK